MFMPSSLQVRFFTVKEQKRLQVEAPSVIAYYVLHMCVLYGTTPSRSKRHHCLWINFTATFAAHFHNRSMGLHQPLQWQVCWASHSCCFLILYLSISTAIFSRSKQGFVLFSPVTIHFLLDFTWSVTNAPFVGSACEGGQIMERCSFHLVPHFEECSPGVNANCEFNFWELLETFPISTVWLLYHKALSEISRCILRAPCILKYASQIGGSYA